MKNIFILFLFGILTTSCATKKYGCKLATTGKVIYNPNYVNTIAHDYHGTGEVYHLDSVDGIKIAFIKVNTLYRGNKLANEHYIIVYGTFATTLSEYFGKTIKFECHNSSKEGEILHVAGGCVDCVVTRLVKS